jgi:FMN phosphatase YigB (HAD superfamily)
VAGSQYHDIEPAVKLGIKAVWVNRKNAHPTRNYSENQVSEVKDLNEFVNRLDS